MARSVMTLQRYVRGWLTRRHYQEQRRLAEQKRQEQEAKAKKGLQINMDNYVNNVFTSHTIKLSKLHASYNNNGDGGGDEDCKSYMFHAIQ
jgi:hypothetical protein